jgi:riboflavin kinase/FMN adenylyltransferase
MMNIGFNPTVSGENIDRNPFFDFDADLYDHKITVSTLKYLRPEFDSVDLLTEQFEKIKVPQSLIYTNFNIY